MSKPGDPSARKPSGSSGGGSSHHQRSAEAHPVSEQQRQSAASRYKKLELLGAGTFGQAYKVQSKQSGRYYVIKEVKMTVGLSDTEQQKTFKEVIILKSCFHANIVRYKEFFMSYSDGNRAEGIINLVMEYADGGDLQKYIHKYVGKREYMPEGRILNYMVQLCFALQYLHKKNIIHRDVKAQNVFLSHGTGLVKLGDFGISRTLSQENCFATTSIGTPQYLSPEVCKQHPYDFKTDVWGLGCVVYEMCALKPPFLPGRDFFKLVQDICSSNYPPIPVCYSNSVREFVKVMMRPEPNTRPTAEQLISARALKNEVDHYMEYIQNIQSRLESERKASTGSSSDGKLDELATLV